MAVTQNSYTGNGSTTQYSFTFPYLKSSEVKAQIDATVTTAFTLANATTVQFNTAPANGAKIKIYRETDTDSLAATFYAGSAIKSEDLNDNFTQNLHTTQEVNARYLSNLGGTMVGDMTMAEDVDIIFEGATDDAYETTLTVADPTADRVITLPNITGTVVTTGDTGTVTATMLAANSVDSSELVDGSVDPSHLASSAVTTAKIADDAVTVDKLANDSVGADQILANGVGTVEIVDNAITTAKIANNAVTQAKIADDAVGADQLASNSVVSASIVDGTIVTADIADNAITNAKMADDSVGADELIDSSVNTAALATNAVTLAKMADSSVGTSELVDTSVTNAKLATDAVTNAKVANDAINTAEIVDNAVTTAKIADAELTTLAGMQSATASILASGTALTATNSEINTICDGKTVQTTISDTDASYPTSGAVVDYVAAQIAPLGGLEVIANEDSFPTQPASGVVISIADAGGIVVNGSGVSTTARTSGNGSDNVTINGFPSTLHSTTLADSMGLLVSSTGSNNTYTYHKLLGKEDDIKNLSDDINDFNNRYRIASSAPSSNNDDGDLYFDTTSKKMKVYNASTSAWDDVAQSSSSHIVTLSESFNGSLTDFTMSTAATDAQSTIVSINGVIQKPNAGTSTPSEGFAISGNTLKLSNAPATGSTYFVVVLGDTVSIGTPSDNTVSTAKIQNLAVTGDKIATNLDLADNKKIRFGTGNDLELYHSGSHSYIKDTGTGDLFICSDDLHIGNAANDEDMAVFKENAQVELYYDNSKSFETTSTGAKISGSKIEVINTTSAGDSQLYLEAGEGGTAFIQFIADNGDDNTDKSRILQADGANLKIQNYDSGSWATKFETTSTGVKYTGDLRADDDYRIKLGTSQELNIYHHNSGSSLIENTNQTLKLRAKAGEDAVVITPDGSVDLYHDNSKKLETHTTGVVVHGNISPDNLYLGDNEKAYFGDGSDLQIYHDGTNSWINNTTGALYIKAAASNAVLVLDNNDDTIFRAVDDGATELYYDNSKKLHTVSGGIYVTGNVYANNTGTTAAFSCTDNGRSAWGSDNDLVIYHDGSHTRLNNSTGNFNVQTGAFVVTNVANTENILIGTADGAVELYYDGSKKAETYSGGFKFPADVWFDNNTTAGRDIFWDSSEGQMRFYDSANISFGNDDDLKIYHDGTNSYIDNNTGILLIDGVEVQIRTNGNEDSVKCHANGNVELYYDGVLAFKTGSNGNYFYKHCDPYVADSFNLGHNYRWKTLYTNNAVDVSSDRNTKNTIIDSDLGLSFINQLRPVSFKKNNQGDSIHYGLIAQEVEDVIINTGKSLEEFSAISKPADKTMGLAYSEFISPLIKAVQELTTEVQTLKTKVAALEAK